MAGNNIVVGSKFRPFSYDEMIKPIQLAQEQHMAIEEEMSNLATRADVFEKLANEQTDPIAYNMYKNYANDLSSQVDVLSKEGLTPGSRQGLLDMRRRYSSEITPIEQAYKRREELTKEQREALQRDPSLLFDVNYAVKSIDYMLGNPNATYTSISGNELTKRASQMASNFVKTIQNNPQYQSILGGQYFQQMQQMGYTPEQIVSTILNDPNAPKELKQIADIVYEQAGLSKYDSDIQTRGRQFINAGLYDAIGTYKYDTMTNRGYMSGAELRRLELEEERLKMMKEQQEWAREEKKGYLMSDGTRVKPIGGGRVLITKPDGSYGGIQAAPSTSTKSTKPAKSDLFSVLEYTGDGFGSPGSSDVFSESDAKQIQINNLNPKAKRKLIEDLAKYDLTPDDVDIYKDQDILSRNHYRIVRKGAGVTGLSPTAPAPVEPASTQGINFDENIGM